MAVTVVGGGEETRLGRWQNCKGKQIEQGSGALHVSALE